MMINELNNILGKTIGGYFIEEYINKGKSGAVYKAKDKNDNYVAFKVIFDSVVSAYGSELQKYRIDQELSLKGHEISGLVNILDGGIEENENEPFFYIVMEYIKGKNLKQFIESHNYDEEFIKKVLDTLVNVSESLINKELAHRDIKPENIMVDEFLKITLMDLGVMKPIGVAKTESQSSEKFFVATQRYASPELLFREEENNINGWRAINLYQIGGVLHDLIMKKELFHEYSPYTNIIKAIEHETPVINSNGYSSRLISLTRKLLVKKPNDRLKYTPISDIISYTENKDILDDLDVEIQKSNSVNVSHKEKLEEISRHKKSKLEIDQRRKDLLQKIKESILNALKLLKEKDLFSDYKFGADFLYKSDKENNNDYSNNNLSVVISKDLSFGFPSNFCFSIGLMVNEESLTTISSVAFYSGNFMQINLANFQSMVFQALNPGKPIHYALGGIAQQISMQSKTSNLNVTPKSIILFEGVFANDDVFQKEITIKLAKLINKAKEIGKIDTEKEIQINKEFALGTRRSSVTYGNQIYFLDSL